MMLLSTYKYHTEILFIFTIFVPKSRRRSIYVYICDILFTLIFIFNMINRIISWIQTHLLFYFLEYVLLFFDNNVDKECEYFSNSESSAPGRCLAFAWFFANSSLALLIKVLLVKVLLINKTCNRMTSKKEKLIE